MIFRESANQISCSLNSIKANRESATKMKSIYFGRRQGIRLRRQVDLDDVALYRQHAQRS